MPTYYVTNFCNFQHRMSDGKPVEHECVVLPPLALKAEREGDFETSQRLIQAAKPMRIMRKGIKHK